MDLPKYTRPEFERRFLEAEDIQPSIAAKACWVIHDKYLSCGRLRLRKIEETDTGKRIYKLCKNLPQDGWCADAVDSRAFLSSVAICAENKMRERASTSASSPASTHSASPGARISDKNDNHFSSATPSMLQAATRCAICTLEALPGHDLRA